MYQERPEIQPGNRCMLYTMQKLVFYAVLAAQPLVWPGQVAGLCEWIEMPQFERQAELSVK